MTRVDVEKHVSLAAAGDREAFGRLVRSYENAAFATALAYSDSRADAEDIVQDAFVLAFCKLGQLREPEHFGRWLRKIVERRASMYTRKRGSTVQVDLQSDAGRSAVAGVVTRDHTNREQTKELWETVATLPQKQRQALLIYYLNDFTYEQAADYLGVPRSTLKGRLQQSRSRLRQQLRCLDSEELAMDGVDVDERVRDAVARIAREDIREEIPLNGAKNVVLFCGIEAAVEICQSEGEHVLVTGSKTSFGTDEEDAARSVAGIRLVADRVADYFETGPHPCAYLRGVTEEGGEPVPNIERIPDDWRIPEEIEEGTSFLSDEFYPEMAVRDEEVARVVRESLLDATRISIIRERVDDTTLEGADVPESIRTAFELKYSSGKLVYGSRGRVDVVIAVPPDVTVTVLSRGRDHIRAWGLRGNVNIVHGERVELADIDGDACLWNTSVDKASGLRGRLVQTLYRIGGTETQYRYDDDGSGPHEAHVRRLAGSCGAYHDISGEVSIDVARADISAVNLSGAVSIRNRFGATTLRLDKLEAGGTYDLESDSGTMSLLLGAETDPAVDLTVRTLCGSIDASLLPGLPDRLDCSFGGDAIVWSTEVGRAGDDDSRGFAEVSIVTRDGDVSVGRAP